MKKEPRKPIPALCRIIKENDGRHQCSFCGSSLYRKWGIFKTPYCIQPKCKNYYKKYIK